MSSHKSAETKPEATSSRERELRKGIRRATLAGALLAGGIMLYPCPSSGFLTFASPSYAMARTHVAAKQASEAVEVQVRVVSERDAQDALSQPFDIRNGQIRGISIAVALPDAEGRYLLATVRDSSVIDSLVEQARQLPEASRQSFLIDWLTRNKTAMYSAYVAAGEPERRFDYTVVLPSEIPTTTFAGVTPSRVPPTSALPQPVPITPAPVTVEQPLATATVPTPAVSPLGSTTVPSPTVAPLPRAGTLRDVGAPIVNPDTGVVSLSFGVVSSSGVSIPVVVEVPSEFLDHSAYPTAAERGRMVATSLSGLLSSRSVTSFLGVLGASRGAVVTIDGRVSDITSLRTLMQTGSLPIPVAPLPEEGEVVAGGPVPPVTPAPPVERRPSVFTFTEQGDGTTDHPYLIESTGGTGRRARIPIAFTTSDNSRTISVEVVMWESQLQSGAIGATRNDLKNLCLHLLVEHAGLSEEEALTMLPPIGPALSVPRRAFGIE